MRRRTLLTTALVATGFTIIPRSFLGGAEGPPPSRTINLAAVGVGGQGGHDLGNMAGENIVALCDVDDRRAAASFKRFPAAKRYKDYRRMLDEMGTQIDAVLVGTPDHTHAVIAMAAMKAGKHVFCEKPLAHSVAELRALRAEAGKRKLITQVGNQGHSSDSIRVFVEWIRDGAIGNVTEIHAGCGKPNGGYCQVGRLEQVRTERPPVPTGLDWDLWQGPAAGRPYHHAFLPGSWRGWRSYGCGFLGDWVCHVVDPSFWALDLDMPTSITAEVEGFDPKVHGEVFPQGTRITYQFPAKGSRGPVKLVWYEGACTIPRPEELEAGRKMVDIGAVVIGDRGKILHGSHGAGEVRIIPEAKMREYKRPAKTLPRVPRGHHRDWLDAIREGRQSSSPFAYGGRLSEIGLLGVIAQLFPGQTLNYDEQAMRFTNNEAATALLNPPYRAGWSL